MQTIRAFIAVDVPSFALETISQIQDRFKQLGLHASWTRPGNIHLTLKFLGETDPQRIPDITQVLIRVFQSSETFRVSLKEVGVFPNWNKPRVVWIGLDDPGGHLAALQSQLETDLETLGWPRENRPFSPHLTLGRLKSPKGKERLREAVAGLPALDPNPFDIDSVKLYRSELTPQGSIYTVLEEVAFQGRQLGD